MYKNFRQEFLIIKRKKTLKNTNLNFSLYNFFSPKINLEKGFEIFEERKKEYYWALSQTRTMMKEKSVMSLFLHEIWIRCEKSIESIYTFFFQIISSPLLFSNSDIELRKMSI